MPMLSRGSSAWKAGLRQREKREVRGELKRESGPRASPRHRLTPAFTEPATTGNVHRNTLSGCVAFG